MPRKICSRFDIKMSNQLLSLQLSHTMKNPYVLHELFLYRILQTLTYCVKYSWVASFSRCKSDPRARPIIGETTVYQKDQERMGGSCTWSSLNLSALISEKQLECMFYQVCAYVWAFQVRHFIILYSSLKRPPLNIKFVTCSLTIKLHVIHILSSNKGLQTKFYSIAAIHFKSRLAKIRARTTPDEDIKTKVRLNHERTYLLTPYTRLCSTLCGATTHLNASPSPQLPHADTGAAAASSGLALASFSASH